jgi:uncharacterized membrane protein HdeD (DUF308 family)
MTTSALLLEIEEVRHKWGWLLALGIGLIILGIIALVLTPVATYAAVLVLGWLMVIGGVMETIQAFRMRAWSGGFFLHLIGGILGILVGLLFVTHPVAGALAWTLLAASLFTVMGAFRAIAAIRLKFPNWGWAVFDGVVTLGLGILLWAQWPWSGLWFLGVALGVSLLLRGWSYFMLALAMRALPTARVQLREAA